MAVIFLAFAQVSVLSSIWMLLFKTLLLLLVSKSLLQLLHGLLKRFCNWDSIWGILAFILTSSWINLASFCAYILRSKDLDSLCKFVKSPMTIDSDDG